MVSIVNGYVCFNCSDAAKAQKGVDPSNPTNDPLQNKAEQQKRDATIAQARAELAKRSDGSIARQTIATQADAVGGTVTVSTAAVLLPGIGGVLDVSL